MGSLGSVDNRVIRSTMVAAYVEALGQTGRVLSVTFIMRLEMVIV